MRDNILSLNIAIAKQAELQAERERVKNGIIPFMRRPLINKVYSHVPRGMLTDIRFYRKSKMKDD